MARSPQYNRSGAVDLLYNPFQVEFLDRLDEQLPNGASAWDFLTLFSGRRGGKTMIGGVGVGKIAMRRPRQYGWVCAPTYDDLYDFVQPAVFSVIPEAWVKDWVASHRELILRNDTRIAFRSLDDPERARGPGLNFLWIDEARKIRKEAWQTALPALTDKKGQAIITTTPNGFDWTYDAFWQTAQRGEPGYWACKYKTAVNPSMDPAYIERARQSMDPLFFQQEFEADFITFTGAIYAGLLESQVLRTEAQIRKVLPEYPSVSPDRTVVIGLDPGADHPFAGIVLVGTPAGIVVVGEYAERQRPVREHVRGLQAVMDLRTEGRGFSSSPRWAMDRTQPQSFLEFQQWGIYPEAAEQGDVTEGIRRVQSWLAAGKLWFVEPWCPRLLSNMRSYRWAENKSRQGEYGKERPLKIDDDLPDALRYSVLAWPGMPGWDEEPIEPGVARRAADPNLQWVYDRVAAVRRASVPQPPAPGVGEFVGSFTDEEGDEPIVTDFEPSRAYGDDYGEFA